MTAPERPEYNPKILEAENVSYESTRLIEEEVFICRHLSRDG
jgi:hypothetical protein